MPQLNHPQIPPAGPSPLSPTATRLCAGAMQNVCRRYGDLPLWDARETAVLLLKTLGFPHLVLMVTGGIGVLAVLV